MFSFNSIGSTVTHFRNDINTIRIVKYEEVIFLVASFFLQKIIRVVVLVPRPLDLGHYLVVCFLLQKMIKLVVLAPWPLGLGH